MAVTTEYSTQYTESYVTIPAKVPETHEWMGRFRIGFFTFVQGSSAGDAGSLAYLIKLPAGKVRLILPLSRVHSSALGSSRTMDLGWIAYTDDDGDAVAVDPNGLDRDFFGDDFVQLMGDILLDIIDDQIEEDNLEYKPDN